MTLQFTYKAPRAVTESQYGVPMGWYTDCDSAICRNCAPKGFARGDFRKWGGFEGWESPIAVCFDDERDSVTQCRACEAVIAHDLTVDGTIYVLRAITEFIASGGTVPTADVMAQWWDAYCDTFGRVELVDIIEDAMVSAGAREYRPKEG